MTTLATKRSLEDQEGAEVGVKKPRPDTSGLQDIRILIDNPEASIVIGKGGQNVKMVREESSAFVSILKSDHPGSKERILTLKGTPENNAKAAQLITRLLITANNERKQSQAAQGDTETPPPIEEYSLKLLVHKFLAGCIIGKAGAIIKEIQAQAGVKMSISNEPLGGSTEKQVSVTGSADAVYTAVLRIFQQLNENPLREGSSNIPYTPGVQHPPPGAYGAPPAPYGAPRQPAYSPYGAPPPPAPQGYSPYGQIATPYGADSMGMKTEKIVIPSVCAGTVIGKGGSIINEIKSNSGCQISIAAAEPTAPQDRVVSITGTSHGINTAIQLIRQRVEAYTPPGGMDPHAAHHPPPHHHPGY